MSGGDVAPWSQGALPILYILLQSLQWWFHSMRRQTCGRPVCGGGHGADVPRSTRMQTGWGVEGFDRRTVGDVGKGCRGADSGSDYQENTSVRRGRETEVVL